ncbi:uncharacterized protein AAES06_020068 [Glossophaga mutica]
MKKRRSEEELGCGDQGHRASERGSEEELSYSETLHCWAPEIYADADHRLAWGHLRNLLETCPAEDALPAQESSPLGSGGAQLAPTSGYIAPAFEPEARVGRFPARNLRLSSPLYSNSRAGQCGAQPPAAERTEDPELGHPPALIGVADPGDTLGCGKERGRETWARVEVGVACCWGWAHQPPALRMLFSFQFSQPPPCTVNGKMEMDVEGVSPRPEPIPRSQGAGGACQAPPQQPQPQPQPQPQQQQLAQDELPGESAGAEDSDDPEARPNSEKGESKLPGSSGIQRKLLICGITPACCGDLVSVAVSAPQTLLCWLCFGRRTHHLLCCPGELLKDVEEDAATPCDRNTAAGTEKHRNSRQQPFP